MNQAPYQLSWQGACPGAVLPAPTHSQALRAPSGVCGPVPFSPMSGRPPGRSWNSPVKRDHRSRNEKADTSVSAFSHLGSRSKKAVTSGYRFCTHHASPLRTHPHRAELGRVQEFHLIPLFSRTRIRVPPGQAGSRKCHKSRSSIFNCTSIIYRPTGKVNPLPQATPHRPADGRVPLPYPLPGVPAPPAAPWTYGWWGLRH